MGRPTLSLGTAGKVRTYRTDAGWFAKAVFRDFDGVSRQVQKSGRTEGAARQRLAEALRDRSHLPRGASITPDTKVSALADRWLQEIHDSKLSPGTIQNYEDRLRHQVLPALGNVKVRELTVGLVDRHLATVKANHGASLAKTTRSVLSGLCGLAARHDALATNPTRYVSKISVKTKRAPKALTPAELAQIRAYLSYDAIARSHDLPDLVALLSATGVRIGELAALTWDCVNLDAGTIEVKATVVRIRNVGLVIKPGAKSQAGDRILELPSWAISLLRRRQEVATSKLVMPSPLGHLRDPSNTRRALQQALARLGYGDEHLTTHVYRRSVASIMESAGLGARRGADQLGHSSPNITIDSYWGRERRVTGAAQALEVLGDD